MVPYLTHTSRIKNLEDHDLITKLKYRYWNACDSKDSILMLDCFSTKAVKIDYEDFGIFDSAKEMVNKFIAFACHDHLVESHAGKNPVITLNNNTASGSWAMNYTLIDTRKDIILNVSGKYEDIYIQENNKWVIHESIFIKTRSIYMKNIENILANPRAQRTLGFK
jgi:hypothetical protein